jgi:hypothetical protein
MTIWEPSFAMLDEAAIAAAGSATNNFAFLERAIDPALEDCVLPDALKKPRPQRLCSTRAPLWAGLRHGSSRTFSALL